jgi:hypothetical protein
MNQGRDRTVLCIKWGNLFPADYVNVLYFACRENITGDFRFVCLTDDPNGLSQGIEHFPIPDLGLTEEMWRHGAWPKLCVFSSDLYGLSGRALFIDLDMVIWGNIDPFFEYPAPFVTTDMGDDWRPNPSGLHQPEAGTCIFAFDLGRESQILDRFVADRAKAVTEHKIEQVWVGAHASSMDYWPSGWVISFKRWLRQPIGRDVWREPRRPPEGTKVLAFHGKPRPITLIRSRYGFWGKFPHLGHGRVKWMADYWTRHGGKL